MTTPDRSALLAHLDADLGALTSMAPDQLGAPVAACPGWDLARLVDHLGRVHRMVLRCLAADGPETYPGFPARSGLDGAELLAWLGESASLLSAALRDDDPDRPVPTFLGPRTVGWWIRRQAHEHLIHRWDAEVALGRSPSLPSELAADGVSELLELRDDRGWTPPDGVRGSLHLHATDGDGEWFVEIDGGLRWEIGHRKGDVAVRATRSDLDLLVWGRPPADEVEVLGERALLDAFLTDDF